MKAIIGDDFLFNQVTENINENPRLILKEQERVGLAIEAGYTQVAFYDDEEEFLVDIQEYKQEVDKKVEALPIPF